MKFLYTVFLFTGLIAATTNAWSQPVERICGHDHLLKTAVESNPDFLQQYDDIFQAAKATGLAERRDDSTLVVQVVFHILYDPADPYQYITDDLIHSQLEALNRDFNRRNADTVNTRDIFLDRTGRANIKFVLAKKVGEQCKNAIIRKEFEPPAFFLPILLDPFIKDDLFGGSSAWNTNKYLNIWVANLNTDPEAQGFLGGYAFIPGYAELLGLPKRHDGVVIDFRFFGQNNPYITEVEPGFGRYSKGRTTVHEVGHWLGLRHTWGDLGTLDPSLGCTSDDGISDTPNEQVPYSAIGYCADTIANSCDEGPGDLPDMFENYMNYSSDECYNMFTREQSRVNRGALQGYRAGTQFDYPYPVTDSYARSVPEGETLSICFELEDCYTVAGALSGQFCGSDSSYASAQGSAVLMNGMNCITYTAGAYVEGQDVDEFCVLTYNAHFNEYDTTRFSITIQENLALPVIESDVANGLSVYPNPSSGKVFLLAEPLAESMKVRIFDALGSEVHTDVLPAGTGQWTFDLSDSPAGLYVLRFESAGTTTFEKVMLR